MESLKFCHHHGGGKEELCDISHAFVFMVQYMTLYTDNTYIFSSLRTAFPSLSLSSFPSYSYPFTFLSGVISRQVIERNILPSCYFLSLIVKMECVTWNFTLHQATRVGRVAQSVQRLTTGWTVRGSNPGGDEIFRTRPDRPCGPPSLLYNGYRIFPGGKAAGAWCWRSTPSSAEVENE
jgi:hypothetical protein